MVQLGYLYRRAEGKEEVAVSEQTLSIIKPDGVSKNLIGEIVRRFEQAGLRVVAMKMIRLDKKEAEGFYQVHRERPFFDSLTTFIASGPVVAMVLEGEDAIRKNRTLMGATDPKKADKGTLRADFGSSIESNLVHGSDSKESAAFEIPFFFSATEIVR
ncbi:MAG TPA: nucleoside-diphosphate kinase [Nitrospiria bacterium]|nr:nucleoside-diphosphate kinase [Nitrospiria bacterium]